jgi:deoxyribonuclease V
MEATMDYHQEHPFPVAFEQMITIQCELQTKIKQTLYPSTPTIVCGVDLAYYEHQAVAVLVVMEHKSKQIIEIVHHLDTVPVAYIPGFLAFRELPLILQAWKKLTVKPDVVFFDGNGMLHPRRMGIATHASFFLQKPTIGIAKTYFLGTHDELGDQQGEYQPIYDEGERIGAVVRTQTGVKPVYVSVGNQMTLADAIRLSLEQVGTESRIPEIVRQADIWSRKIRREYLENV